MQAQPEFGFERLVTELLRGLADSIADRPGETDAQRFGRHQAAVFLVMAFLPRDAIETILAGQCVMTDVLLRDATRDLLRSEAEPAKRRIRSQLIALGRLFLRHLEQLQQYQSRPAQQPEASPHAEPEPAKMPQRTAASPPVFAGAQSPIADAEPAQSIRAAAVEPSSDAPPPAAAPPGGKADLVLQRGFQNRRMRRALQFNKQPARKSSRAASKPAAASQPAGPPGF